MGGLAVGTLALLAAFGLVGGIGITAVGPGGVLATIGLFVFTGLSPAAVSGTAIVTHLATGALGTAAYWRSGQLRRHPEGNRPTRRTALILALAAVLGTPVGVLCNSVVSGRVFAVLLGIAVGATGILVWVRERSSARDGAREHQELPVAVIAVVGFAVAAAAGLFGVGGPMLSVPVLVALGMPVLPALAAAQVQSVLIAGVGTVSYLAVGAINWPLAVLVGLPELAGVLIGWKIAHAVPARTLKYALALVLIGLAPYLALHG
ncbi:MAG: sulfite exporter TauE/SafE family protein [Sciscionella sp.]